MRHLLFGSLPLLMLSTPPALAQDVTKELARCAAIAESVQRLSCYDALARQPQPQTKVPQQQFGAEQLPRQAETAPPADDAISAAVSEILFTPYGAFVLTLDNGQVWRQLDGDTPRLAGAGSLAHAGVTISRGAFGSYNLTFAGQRVLFKVRRVK